MFRAICMFLAFVASGATFSQEVELPTSETVLALYENHGIPFDEADTAGRPALLILSAGCGQCVELATTYQEELTYLANEKGFNARFVEVPGAIAPPDSGADDDIGANPSSGEPQTIMSAARESANLASMILECTDPNSAEEALSMIADIGRSARLVTGAEPESSLPSDWANWPFLTGVDNAGQSQSIAAGVLQVLVGARKIDLDDCDQAAMWDRLSVRHEAILESGITYVPGLYLLPNETYPWMMVWQYDDLIELVMAQ